MNPLRLVAGLVPFLSFSLLTHLLPVGPAAAISALIALAVLLSDLKGGLKSVPAAGVVILGLMAAVGFTVGPSTEDLLTVYGQGIATVLLAAFILLTASAAPFTAQFARETTPREYWTAPSFLTLNRQLSTAWGLTVLLIGGCHLLGSVLADAGQTPVLTAACEWVLPVLAIIRTMTFTQRRVAAATAAPTAAR